uniref:ATP-dependent transporter ycf16 n=1 Tax=Coccolithus braarudii TaxID=221442 RepID=A0A7S0LKU3_9EUKA|mmetsp:Transcript_45737/g.97525  ORF Transcript_45737/g.97525 Transcript_45737/m.97525 type:complete len:604 (+) Transcript_45737:253-2064(+)
MESQPAPGVVRLVRESAPEYPLLCCGIACTGIATLGELSLMGASSTVVDLLSSGTAPTEAEIDGTVGKLMLLFCIVAVFRHLGEYLLRVAGENVVACTQTALFKSLLQLDVAFFDAISAGSLTSVLANDVEAIRLAVAKYFPSLAHHVCACTCALIAMLRISVQLSLTGALVGPVIGILIAYFNSFVRHLTREQQAQLAAASALAAESFAFVRTIKAFGREGHFAAAFAAEAERSRALSLREMAWHKLWNGSNMVMGVAGTLLVIRSGARAVAAGELSAGDLAAFVVYGVMAGHAANDAVNAYAFVTASAGRASRALQMLDQARRAVATDEVDLDAISPSRPLGEAAMVCFSNVSFRYATRCDACVTRVTFKVEYGTTTALVGPSGCGKSSLLLLLLRFYKPEEGCVRVDGTDLAAIPERTLRQLVAVVFQDTPLFSGTIRQNILLGANGEDEARLDCRMVSASVAANAHDFIVASGGYDQQVGERGVTLSGGQRQRIAIARALLGQPRLLLLDEATSALDSKAEAAVQEGFCARDGADRSTVVVAHRLATIRDAFQILVLERGIIVERGTHGSLLAAGGMYARMAALQQVDGAHTARRQCCR